MCKRFFMTAFDAACALDCAVNEGGIRQVGFFRTWMEEELALGMMVGLQTSLTAACMWLVTPGG